MKFLTKNIINYIYILYLEFTYHFLVFKTLSLKSFIYILLFSLLPTIFINIITSIIDNEKINKYLNIFINIFLSILFIAYYINYEFYGNTLSIYSMFHGEQVFGFMGIIIDVIKYNILGFILLLLPIPITIIFNKYIKSEKLNYKSLLIEFIALITTFIICIISANIDNKDIYSAKNLYFNKHVPNQTSQTFGILTTLRLDIKRTLTNFKEETIIIDNEVEEEIEKKEYNVLDIDFESLIETETNEDIKIIHEYLNSTTPTEKNEYTGMFKGKNLIFILAEGFNEIAVDEVRTPTLYKMINEGFVFSNFYSPVHLSTTGGEFQAVTGLIPTQESLTLWKKEKPTVRYALGNAFNNIGYRTQAYHNWTHTYYKRQVTMKTLGFNKYIGCGNGLEKEMNCGWLPYDTDMINVTTPKYLGQEGNFMTYYITVSGHSPYNSGSRPARRYIKEVTGDYSYAVKYYLASQMELDRAVEQLIKNLEASGELDNTVIALVGDHYPYTLSTDEVNEVSTYTKDGVVGVNKSNFIIWNNQMEEPIVVDKLGSQIDVLPTLLNLFGIEYDSRLIIGKDILSNGECLAIFSNYSWVSDYGTYYANKKKFVPKEGTTLENQEEYVKAINNRVSNYYSISKLIMDNDYYNYILGSE